MGGFYIFDCFLIKVGIEKKFLLSRIFLQKYIYDRLRYFSLCVYVLVLFFIQIEEQLDCKILDGYFIFFMVYYVFDIMLIEFVIVR